MRAPAARRCTLVLLALALALLCAAPPAPRASAQTSGADAAASPAPPDTFGNDDYFPGIGSLSGRRKPSPAASPVRQAPQATPTPRPRPIQSIRPDEEEEPSPAASGAPASPDEDEGKVEDAGQAAPEDHGTGRRGKVVGKAVQRPSPRPAQRPSGHPVESPVESPTESPAELPAQEASQSPAERPPERPSGRLARGPAGRAARARTLAVIVDESEGVGALDRGGSLWRWVSALAALGAGADRFVLAGLGPAGLKVGPEEVTPAFLTQVATSARHLSRVDKVIDLRAGLSAVPQALPGGEVLLLAIVACDKDRLPRKVDTSAYIHEVAAAAAAIHARGTRCGAVLLGAGAPPPAVAAFLDGLQAARRVVASARDLEQGVLGAMLDLTGGVGLSLTIDRAAEAREIPVPSECAGVEAALVTTSAVAAGVCLQQGDDGPRSGPWRGTLATGARLASVDPGVARLATTDARGARLWLVEERGLHPSILLPEGESILTTSFTARLFLTPPSSDPRGPSAPPIPTHTPPTASAAPTLPDASSSATSTLPHPSTASPTPAIPRPPTSSPTSTVPRPPTSSPTPTIPRTLTSSPTPTRPSTAPPASTPSVSISPASAAPVAPIAEGLSVRWQVERPDGGPAAPATVVSVPTKGAEPAFDARVAAPDGGGDYVLVASIEAGAGMTRRVTRAVRFALAPDAALVAPAESARLVPGQAVGVRLHVSNARAGQRVTAAAHLVDLASSSSMGETSATTVVSPSSTDLAFAGPPVGEIGSYRLEVSGTLGDKALAPIVRTLRSDYAPVAEILEPAASLTRSPSGEVWVRGRVLPWAQGVHASVVDQWAGHRRIWPPAPVAARPGDEAGVEARVHLSGSGRHILTIEAARGDRTISSQQRIVEFGAGPSLLLAAVVDPPMDPDVAIEAHLVGLPPGQAPRWDLWMAAPAGGSSTRLETRPIPEGMTARAHLGAGAGRYRISAVAQTSEGPVEATTDVLLAAAFLAGSRLDLPAPAAPAAFAPLLSVAPGCQATAVLDDVAPGDDAARESQRRLGANAARPVALVARLEREGSDDRQGTLLVSLVPAMPPPLPVGAWQASIRAIVTLSSGASVERTATLAFTCAPLSGPTVPAWLVLVTLAAVLALLRALQHLAQRHALELVLRRDDGVTFDVAAAPRSWGFWGPSVSVGGPGSDLVVAGDAALGGFLLRSGFAGHLFAEGIEGTTFNVDGGPAVSLAQVAIGAALTLGPMVLKIERRARSGRVPA